ncbi:hypothetical protein FDB28_11415 [Clostridium botulinum]|nr:hypothetical protein [Clostridium botulinum]NFS96967.1 hypothetical protein [Clostridium botulinum]
MDWNRIFKNYVDIKSCDKIYSFCNEKENWELELKHIFLHNNKSEMFILIDVTQDVINLFKSYNVSINDNQYTPGQYELLLKDIIKNWENKVLNYLNFELEDDNNRNIIKYNITLIILCCKEKMSEEILNNSNSIMNEEHSTCICRKIFMFDENDYEEELNYLPFYFEKIKKENSLEVEQLEKELRKTLDEAAEFSKEVLVYLEEVKNDNNR